MSTIERFFAVVPAAGSGTRVGGPLPKQYLPLAGRTVLECTALALLEAAWIERILVVVAPDDERAWGLLAPVAARSAGRVGVAAVGGATRRDSVLAGLHELRDQVADDDWVLVHDAARPGLRLDSLERLREALAGDPVGGLLALPLADTIKRAAPDGRVSRTEPREGLWQAQTPQMFRYAMLVAALAANPQVTDEAAALEAAGMAPRLVEGDRGNFKVTTAEDLRMMQVLMQARRTEEERGG
jgi:2-C-methyl-D-erythritol 4-phosphate cytidylyltransferase